MFGLLRSARKLNLPVHVVLELFQTMVLPILLYGCEIWGSENVNILEKLQLKFLKHLFRLNQRTMSNLIYGETGIYPIHVLVKCRMIKFWTELISQASQDKFSAKMYKFLYTVQNSDTFRFPWLNHVKAILIDNGFECVWYNQSFQDASGFVKFIQDEIKHEFQRSWSKALNSSNKCIYYRMFKTNFEKERYISRLPDMYAIALMKFRCVSHKLRIELGRIEGLERNERVCKDCSMNVLGD